MEICDLLLENLTLNNDFVKSTLPYIERRYFEDEYQKVIFDTISNHIDKYGSLPTRESILIDVDNVDINTKVYDDIVETITDWEGDNSDIQWLTDSTEKWCQDRALLLALEQAVEISSDEDTGVSRGKIPEILRDALAVSFDTSVGHDYLDDSEARYDYYNTAEEKIKFDIDWLNKITDGGVPRKTLNLIMGLTGTGKSLWLCHLAAHYMSQGLDVLYITMEMAEERIAERIDANILDITLQKLSSIGKENYLDLINEFKKKTKGNLIIKEYPTGAAHAGHFRHLLNELKNKKGYVPDVLIVDYVNICASSRLKMGGAVNSYTMVKSVAEELRGLGVEYNIPVWTATQSGRQSTGVSDMDIDDVSESFGLVQTTDFMFVIISTPELDDLKHQLIKILKNRYGSASDDRVHTVGIEKAKMRVFDLSTSNIPTMSQPNKPVGHAANGKDFSGFKI